MSPGDSRGTKVLDWLFANGYDDIAANIEQLQKRWKDDGRKTRRNWWEILAGGKNGKPKTVDGIVFPVLKAAQARQGLDITPNAISRNKGEPKEQQWIMGRWKNDDTLE